MRPTCAVLGTYGHWAGHCWKAEGAEGACAHCSGAGWVGLDCSDWIARRTALQC